MALVYRGECSCLVDTASVCFNRLETTAIDWYVGTGEPLDKAGAYAIQGRAAQFVTRLEGSYSGVMGLPLYETAQLIEARCRAESLHE